MAIPKAAMLLRIYIGEAARFQGKPLHSAIVLKAREQHLAGATVLRGPMGYGHSSHIHRAGLMEISEDLPVVIEMVDSEERIRGFLPVLDTMLGPASGLVTLERVEVLRYGTEPVGP